MKVKQCQLRETLFSTITTLNHLKSPLLSPYQTSQVTRETSSLEVSVFYQSFLSA